MEREGMFGRYMGEMEEENGDWYDHISLYQYMAVSTKSTIKFFEQTDHDTWSLSLVCDISLTENIKTRMPGLHSFLQFK